MENKNLLSIEEAQQRWSLFIVKTQENTHSPLGFSWRIETSPSNAFNYFVLTSSVIEEVDSLHLKRKAMEELGEMYPNLFFSPNGIWIKRGHRDSEGFKLNFDYDLLNPNYSEIEKLHTLATLANEPNKFYCTHCLTVKDQKEEVAFIFASRFCKPCSLIPEVNHLISESKKSNFYD